MRRNRQGFRPRGAEPLEGRVAPSTGGPPAVAGETPPALVHPPGDFDGTGTTDIAVFSSRAARWAILGAAGPRAVPLGTPGLDVPAPGDFDGDGKADPAVYRPSTGQWIISRTSLGPLVVTFGAPGDVAVPGDFDGDGKADLAVYRPSTAQWFVWGSSSGPRAQQFGAPGDLPVPADYDGDGRADLAVFRPSTAQWFVWGSSAGPRSQQFGAPGLDLPVPADYDGDGRVDLAVFRPTTAQWVLDRSTAGLRAAAFGQPSLDLPIPGDYDGDGKADLATYRPTSSTFFLDPSTTRPRSQQFGVPSTLATGAPEQDVPPLAPLIDRSTPAALVAVTPFQRRDDYARVRHQQDLERALSGPDRVVFLGDSITDLWGDAGRDLGAASRVWDAQIAPLGAANFGVAGDQTEDLLWRVEGGELAGHPKVAVVLVGVDNLVQGQTPIETAAGVAAVVGAIRTASPGTRVLLLGLFPVGDPFRTTIGAEVGQVNALISRLGDGDHVRFLDIGATFLRPDGTLDTALFLDGLHPTVAGYRAWAAAIRGPLRAMLDGP